MADATFDGVNLIITLPVGEAIVDVETDLYSAWKRFMLADKENMRFPLAFRTIGGDALSPGIDAGAYFFLQNDLGWRIRPAEEDATVLITGNLAAEDSALPMTIPTVGAFTVLLQGLQPITQSVEDILTEQQNTAYEGVVAIDIISGSAGTAFPVGTRSEPSNNLGDAVLIAVDKGIQTFEVRGSLTLDRAFLNWTFIGVGSRINDIILLNGQDVSGSRFDQVCMRGTMVSPTVPVQVVAGLMNNVVNFQGTIVASGFLDDVLFAPGQTDIVAGYSAAPGMQVVILDYNNQVAEVFVRGWHGFLQVSNCTQAAALFSLELDSGSITFNPSNTAGTFILAGLGTLINNLGVGVTFTKDGFVEGLDVKLIKALDAGNITITGSSPFVITVIDPDDGVTVLGTWEVTADGKTRTRTS